MVTGEGSTETERGSTHGSSGTSAVRSGGVEIAKCAVALAHAAGHMELEDPYVILSGSQHRVKINMYVAWMEADAREIV